MVRGMNAVAARRAGKSLRLKLPLRHPAALIATCFGMGNLPVVCKNTHLGSLSVSLITPFIFWPIIMVWGTLTAVMVLAVANFLGAWAMMVVEADGDAASHDSRAVVVDEFLGAGLASLTLPLLWVDFGASSLMLQAAACLFIGLIFRILDIAKVFPASILDLHWHDPYGVIADDLVAGLQTILVVFAFCLIF